MRPSRLRGMKNNKGRQLSCHLKRNWRSQRKTISVRAKTDFAFADFQKNAGGKINHFYYIRKPTPLNEQPVVRMNRDNLYAGAVVDTKGGATLTIPKFPDNRYFSVLVIDNDHYAPLPFSMSPAPTRFPRTQITLGPWSSGFSL